MTIEEHYTAIAPKLTNWLVSTGSTYEDACDLVQRAFLKLWEMRDDLRDNDSAVAGLVYTIAKNLRKNMWRDDAKIAFVDEIGEDAAGATQPAPSPSDAEYLRDRLEFMPIDRHIALHLTCSTREMGVDKDLIALAKMCSTNVYLPEGVGCCGFAGDRGFTFPEMNKYALRKLRPQIEANHIEVGYSNSRTCEIGLETNTGIPYMSIVYLVNECTTPKS